MVRLPWLLGLAVVVLGALHVVAHVQQVIEPLADAQADRRLAAAGVLEPRLPADVVFALRVRHRRGAVVHDEHDVATGADVLVEVRQQRQEGCVSVLIALAEAVVLDAPDDYAVLLVLDVADRPLQR